MEPSCEAVLRKQSFYWGSRLPQRSVFDSDDLFQIGWFVYQDCIKKHKKNGDAKLSFYYWVALNNKFKSIVGKEWNCSEKELDGFDVSLIRQESASPERLAMVKQYIDEVSKLVRICDSRNGRVKIDRYGKRIADLLVNGIPKDFFVRCRRTMRCRCYVHGWESRDAAFKVEKVDFEEFFGNCIDQLRVLYYNILGN